MSTLSSPGRLFYALAVTLIGIQFIIYSDFNSTLFPLQPLLAGKNLVLRSFGIITVLCGFAMGIEKFAEQAAILLALMLVLVFFTIHVPVIYEHPRNGSAWTASAEVLAIAMGALMYPANFRINKLKKKPSKLLLQVAGWGLTIFGFTLFVFGVQHFVYTEYVASVMPSWILLANFVTYLAGILFILISVAFILRRRIQISALLFSIIFLIIILIVHVPRLINHPQLRDEWTSGFIAMAMLSIGLMIGGISPSKEEDDSHKNFLDTEDKHLNVS
jgi:uncharacterized membrane protein